MRTFLQCGMIFLLVTGILIMALLMTGEAQQPPVAAPANECQASVRVEQEVSTYTKQLLAKVIVRTEQAEQALAAAKQDAVRMEEELARVRQAWDDLKSKYTAPAN